MLNPIDEFRDELEYELTDKQIESMMKFIEFLFDGVDIVEVDISSASEYLGDILGINYKEDLFDQLFSNFCLGK